MLVEALQTLLTTDAGMVTLLGTPATRPDSTNGVFPEQAIDQVSMPYIVMTEITGEPTFITMKGGGTMVTERWRLDYFGTTYLKAKEFAKAGTKFLLGVPMGKNDATQVFFHHSEYKSEVDDHEGFGRGTLYSTHVDIEFVYTDLSA